MSSTDNNCTVVCRLDGQGDVVKINYSTAQRDSFMSLPVAEIRAFYRALKVFESMLISPSYCIRHRMEPGALSR